MSAGIQPKSGFSMMWKQSVSPSQRFSSSSVHFWGKKLFEKSNQKTILPFSRHKEPSQGSQKSKSIQTKMLINLCQIKNTIFQLKIRRKKPPKKKSRHEKEAKKIKSLSLPQRNEQPFLLHLKSISAIVATKFITTHIHKKNCSPGLVAIWLEALENAKQFQLLFSLPLFIFWILSNKVIMTARRRKHKKSRSKFLSYIQF